MQHFCLHWCKQPDMGLPKPDLVMFLQLQLEEAVKRGEFGCERYENRDFQERVLQRFHQLMGDRTLNWKVSGTHKARAAVGARGALRNRANPNPQWLFTAWELGATWVGQATV